jgi:quercetin dioxygenase-like cupin family protein
MMPGLALTFGYVQIVPGAKNPEHYHPNSDEVLQLLAGALDQSLGGEVHQLLAGMALHAPLGVEHDAIKRAGQMARMVVAYSTGIRQTVMREGGRE